MTDKPKPIVQNPRYKGATPEKVAKALGRLTKKPARP